MNDDLGICPKCGDDAYEVSSATHVSNPTDGQRGAWLTTLSCGCTITETLTWYDRAGWV